MVVVEIGIEIGFDLGSEKLDADFGPGHADARLT